MELTYNILKTTNRSPRYSDIKTEFLELNLDNMSRTVTSEQFLIKIGNKKFIDTASKLIKEYFQDVTNDIGFSILMCYYISAYSNELFTQSKSKSEKKLVLYANTMVVMIYKLVKDTTLGDSFYREFYNTVDTYYSLYSIWKSEDSIDKAIQLLEQILYDVGISYLKTRKMASLNVPVQKSASVSTPRSDIVKSTSLSVVSSSSYDYFINYDYGPIEENIHKLFKINSKFALNLILDNYSKFKSNEKLQNIIWTVIKAFFPKPKDEVLLLLISQVRIKLIPLLTSIQDRKDIYYDIDSEKIIDNIRNDQFNFKSIKEIIDRLQAKVYVVNHNYKYHKINKYSGTRILYIFKDMFNTII